VSDGKETFSLMVKVAYIRLALYCIIERMGAYINQMYTRCILVTLLFHGVLVEVYT
jgi:hypothetical protein